MSEQIDYGHNAVDYNAYNPSNDNYDVKSLEFLFKTDGLLDDLRNYLSGLRFDNNLNQYIRECAPRVNSYGSMIIIGELKLRLSKIFSLSWYDLDTIRERLAEFHENMSKMFADKYTLFGTTLADSEIIISNIIDYVEATFMRALNGRSYNLLIKTARFEQVTKVENKETSDRVPSNNLLANLFRRDKRGVF
jgi:hypothetical protein